MKVRSEGLCAQLIFLEAAVEAIMRHQEVLQEVKYLL